MSRLAVIELHKEELKFSAGHFMVFSKTRRESTHGHDYQIQVAFHTLIPSNGMSFDVRDYKEKIRSLCQMLDYHFILPAQSEFLRIEDQNDHWVVHFNQQQLKFYKEDAIVLPICNATLEELSNWFLQKIIEDSAQIQAHHIQGVTVKVYNGRGESGSTSWGMPLNALTVEKHAASEMILS